MNTEHYRIAPGGKVDLKAWNPDDKHLFDGDKKAGEAALPALNKQLETLQELLYAESKHKILIVLQGMDTSGKDGTIRHVFEGVNPQGVKVASFKAPTPLELAHDYLWRIHQHTPARRPVGVQVGDDILETRSRHAASACCGSRHLSLPSTYGRNVHTYGADWTDWSPTGVVKCRNRSYGSTPTGRATAG